MDTPLLSALHRGDIHLLCHDGHGCICADAALPRAVLCGSFNPLHAGHRRLAEVAARRLGVPVEFEIGLLNADKRPLTVGELDQRLRQFVGLAPVWLTRMPTFAAKARLFPGVTFVVGADTAERIVAPRFYGGSADEMLAALNGVRAAGCRFLVAGRVDRIGQFVTADSLDVTPSIRDLFDCIPECDFRLDVSSTRLRDSAGG
jgi:hypothetical protein